MPRVQNVSFKFERIEKKFRMTAEQYAALQPVLESRFRRDGYGETTVCNIYYDTPDFMLIRRSIERPLFKEKLRLRSYGIPAEDDAVFVEIKRKLNGIGYKRRVILPFWQAKKLLRGEAVGCGEKQIEKELLEFTDRYHPQPAVYLTYTRFAMTANDDSRFRVTIDRNLKYRMTDIETPNESGMEPIMPNETCVLMEIKALGAIPEWFAAEMSRLRIYQAPFSKVGTCYTRHIAPKLQYK